MNDIERVQVQEKLRKKHEEEEEVKRRERDAAKMLHRRKLMQAVTKRRIDQFLAESKTPRQDTKLDVQPTQYVPAPTLEMKMTINHKETILPTNPEKV